MGLPGKLLLLSAATKSAEQCKVGASPPPQSPVTPPPTLPDHGTWNLSCEVIPLRLWFMRERGRHSNTPWQPWSWAEIELREKCLPQETSPWHLETQTETRSVQITHTCRPSQELGTCGYWISHYWTEWNITGCNVLNKIRGSTHSLMFPSRMSSEVLAPGKIPSSICRLCGLKRMEIMEWKES